MDIILKEKKMKRSHLELAKQLIKDTNATLIECLKALNDTDGNFEKAKKILSAPFSFFQKSIKNESTDPVSEVQTMTKPTPAMQLRKETDACMFECAQALEESDGDYETAKMIIRQEIVILPKYEPRKIDPNKPILSQDSHDLYRKYLDGKPDFTHLFLGKLKPESKFVAVIYNNKFIRDYTPEGYIIAGSDKIEFDPIVFECEDNLYQRLFDQHYFEYKNGRWIISAYEVKNGEIISKLNHQYDTRYLSWFAKNKNTLI